MGNTEKQARYAILKKKLSVALKHGFWMEACMIEYAIIEDRTAAMLARCDVCNNPYEKRLRNKLNSLKHQIGKEHPILSKKVKAELLDEVQAWADGRNALVHRACREYDEEAARKTAEKGKTLTDAVCNAAQRVQRLAEKTA